MMTGPDMRKDKESNRLPKTVALPRSGWPRVAVVAIRGLQIATLLGLALGFFGLFEPERPRPVPYPYIMIAVFGMLIGLEFVAQGVTRRHPPRREDQSSP